MLVTIIGITIELLLLRGQQKMVEKLERQVKHLVHLVNSAIDLASGGHTSEDILNNIAAVGDFLYDNLSPRSSEYNAVEELQGIACELSDPEVVDMFQNDDGVKTDYKKMLGYYLDILEADPVKEEVAEDEVKDYTDETLAESPIEIAPSFDRDEKGEIIVSKNFKKITAADQDDFKEIFKQYVDNIRGILNSEIEGERESHDRLKEEMEITSENIENFISRSSLNEDKKKRAIGFLTELRAYEILSPKEIKMMDGDTSEIDNLENNILSIM